MNVRRALPALFAIVGMLLVLDVIAIAFGQSPLTTLRLAAAGTWGTPYGIGQVLFKATPLLISGLAFQIAFRAGLFNIGVEGQLASASLVAGWVASKLDPGRSALIAVPLVLLAAMVTGALAALPPALLRARRNVHEVITTIMMNRIVEVLLPFTLVTLLGAANLRTADAAPGALLMRLDHVWPALRGSAASLAFPFAVGVAFLAARALDTSRLGREMRWVGMNADASRAEGIDVPRRLASALLLSGAVAGLVSASTVLGYKGYYELGLGAGAGFAGIAVALLGRGKPLGMVLAAILLGTLEQAGLAINATVPKEAMSVLEAAAILLVAVGQRAQTPSKAAST
jgi:simple sugar transport system permease protein